MSKYSGRSSNPGFPILWLALFLSAWNISCSRNSVNQYEKPLHPTGSIISMAERFTLERKIDYTKLTIINPWQGAENINQTYFLIRRGASIPIGIDSGEIIFVPLRKIVCMSTTHLAMISALNEESTISAVSGAGFVYNKAITEKVMNGIIMDIGYESNMNKELLIKISPDIIMMYGIGSESVGYTNKIKELGLITIFNADYLEENPLGKAEWIKLFGALYCKEEMADTIFKSLSEAYTRTKIFIENNIDKRPDVMLGLPFKDTWFISPGNSYISRIINDAGGNYLWKETESSISMPYGIENVYLKALKAEFWLNIGNVKSVKEIAAIDSRLTGLSCLKNGNLFNNNKRINENGGNDYWESGCLKPHIILKDIASILHPGLFSGEKLFYYQKIN
jgi:iron complex transport system substrate-binding protein